VTFVQLKLLLVAEPMFSGELFI